VVQIIIVHTVSSCGASAFDTKESRNWPLYKTNFISSQGLSGL